MYVGQVAAHQPILFGQTPMSEAGRDGDSRCALQRHREAENCPAVQIDREGDVRASNDRPVLLTTQPDIAGGAVDLHTLPRHAGAAVTPGQQAARAGLTPSLAASRKPQLILRAVARLDRFARWRRHARSSAAAFDLG